MGRVELLSIDCEAVEEFELGQLAKDEVDLLFAGQVDEEGFEASRGVLDGLCWLTDQSQRVDHIGEGLLALWNMVVVQINLLKARQIVPAELLRQAIYEVVRKVQLSQERHLDED